jgi:hypothetical protein
MVWRKEMTRLYFDLANGDDISRDQDGICFADLQSARNSAVISLLEIMKSRHSSDNSELTFVVRDASDQTAFTAKLSLKVIW